MNPSNRAALPKFIALGSRNREWSKGQRADSGDIKGQTGAKSATKSGGAGKPHEVGISLVEKVLGGWDSNDQADRAKVVVIVSETLDSLRTASFPDQQTYLTIVYLCKLRPDIFKESTLVNTCLDLLRQGQTASLMKNSPILSFLAANLLYQAYRDQRVWPLEFVKGYLEDGLRGRIWIDHEQSHLLVQNILTVFKPPLTSAREDEETTDTESVPICSRYSSPELAAQVESYMADTLTEALSNFEQSRQADKSNQLQPSQKTISSLESIIKMLEVSVGLRSCRRIASSNLETWLNLPWSSRYAKVLLARLCERLQDEPAEDMDCAKEILSIKLRGTHNIQLFLDSVSKLVSSNAAYWNEGLKLSMHTEGQHFSLSSTNKSFSTFYVSAILRSAPNGGLGHHLANFFHSCIHVRADHQKLASLIRFISLNPSEYKFDFAGFCKTLITPAAGTSVFDRQEVKASKDQQVYFVKQLLSQIVLTLLMSTHRILSLQSKYSHLADAAAGSASHQLYDKYKYQLRSWRFRVATVQRDAVTWFYSFVLSNLPVGDLRAEVFDTLLSKVLFVLNPTALASSLAPTPIEQAQKQIQLVCHKMPLLEETVTRVLLISLTDGRLGHSHALQILDSLLRRACELAALPDYSDALTMKGDKLLEGVLQLSRYKPPESVAEGSSLALSSLFWRGCVLLVLIAAFNLDTVARKSWEQVPALRYMIEMIITQVWSYPPFPNETTTELLQCRITEEQDRILEVENASIGQGKSTMENSVYLKHSYMMLLDPGKVLRIAPDTAVESLRKLDMDFDLGYLFRNSSEPNMLATIMREQGPDIYIEWLLPLVRKDPRTLSQISLNATSQVLLFALEKCRFCCHFCSCSGSPTVATAPCIMNDCGRTSKGLSYLDLDLDCSNAQKQDHPDDSLIDLLPQMFASVRQYSDQGNEQTAAGQALNMEILSCFLDALVSPSSSRRYAGRCALYFWLCASSLPHSFQNLRPLSLSSQLEWLDKGEEGKREKIAETLLSAIDAESDPNITLSYLQFLLKGFDPEVGSTRVVSKICQLLISRRLFAVQLLSNEEGYAYLLRVLQIATSNWKISHPSVSREGQLDTNSLTWDILIEGVIAFLATPYPGLEKGLADAYDSLVALVAHPDLIQSTKGARRSDDHWNSELLLAAARKMDDDSIFCHKAKLPGVSLRPPTYAQGLQLIRCRNPALMIVGLRVLERCKLPLLISEIGLPRWLMEEALCLLDANPVIPKELDSAIVLKFVSVHLAEGARHGAVYCEFLASTMTQPMDEQEDETNDDEIFSIPTLQVSSSCGRQNFSQIKDRSICGVADTLKSCASDDAITPHLPPFFSASWSDGIADLQSAVHKPGTNQVLEDGIFEHLATVVNDAERERRVDHGVLLPILNLLASYASTNTVLQEKIDKLLTIFMQNGPRPHYATYLDCLHCLKSAVCPRPRRVVDRSASADEVLEQLLQCALDMYGQHRVPESTNLRVSIETLCTLPRETDCTTSMCTSESKANDVPANCSSFNAVVSLIISSLTRLIVGGLWTSAEGVDTIIDSLTNSLILRYQTRKNGELFFDSLYTPGVAIDCVRLLQVSFA